MSAITRWVLAHKRIVTLFWIALTVVGIASANSATKALDQKFSVPGKEGWETNVAIAEHFQRHGRRHRPDRASGHAALRRDRRLARREGPAPASSTKSCEPRCPTRGSPPTPPRAAGASSRAMARTTFAIVYPKPDPNSAFGENPDAAKAARAAASRHRRLGRARSRQRLRCAAERVRRGQRDGRAPRVRARRLRRPDRPRVRLRAPSWPSCRSSMAIVSIMTTFLLVWGLDRRSPTSRSSSSS